YSKQAQQAALLDAYMYPRTTNVARLYHATMGFDEKSNKSGIASNPEEQKLLDMGWFKYYIQGVGTRFEEINDLDPGMMASAFGLKGEDRINWGLTRICKALGMCNGFDFKPLDLAQAQTMVKNMGNAAGRQQQLDQFINDLRTQQNHPELYNIELYIFGCGRGAAEARTMINWLYDYLLSREENAETRQWIEEQRRQKAIDAQNKTQNAGTNGQQAGTQQAGTQQAGTQQAGTQQAGTQQAGTQQLASQQTTAPSQTVVNSAA
ncbi:DUF2235 domain-containing protein, partial [Neisseriaceae bacterium ESL0693]|nr:DUF2235 domain-containing protein [Neisseriaceae bacterium ESL0693]